MKATTYKPYLLSVLLVTLAFSTADRLALGLVQQEIKTELALSDTQLGLLTGFAFALFYAVLGIPIARWADRGNRVTIIAVATALWSAAMAACGFATTYVQLLLARIGVAVGEAGCIPPAHSLIADNFDREERPRAVARYMLGQSLGVGIGYFVTGWFNQLFGWRTTFMLLGLPGVVVALIAWLTLKEPRRERLARQPVAAAETAQPSLVQIFVVLWRNRSFRHLLIAYTALQFFVFGITQWQPTFFIRSYGLQTGELGTWFAITGGVAGLVGTYAGGELAARHARGNEPLQLKLMAGAYLFYGVTYVLTFLSSSAYLAFALLIIGALAFTAAYGPLFAIIQMLVPSQMRAVSIAIVYLSGNLLGMGLGPVLSGVLSDALHPALGEESLRYALLVLAPGFAIVSWHVWRASDSVDADLRAAAGEDSIRSGLEPAQ